MMIALPCWFACLLMPAAPTPPAVAAFDRYHAKGEQPVEGGKLLLTELNCVVCHAADGVVARKGPVLDAVGSRVRPAWLRQFLTNPQATKPGTTMPDMLGGVADRGKAVEALVQYLSVTGSPKFEAIDAKAVAAGRDRYHKVGCVACHGERDTQGNARSLPAGGIPLPDLKTKYTLASLTSFLNNPHEIRPGGRMPKLLNGKEPREVACYLLQGSKGRTTAGTVNYATYHGQWDKLPNLASMKPKATGVVTGLDLGVAGQSNDYAIRFTGVWKVDRDDTYKFAISSDDGSRLIIDGVKVLDNDGIHPNATREGTAELKAGLHKVEVWYFQGGGEAELELTVQGRHLQLVDMGQLLAASEKDLIRKPSQTEPDEDVISPNPELVSEGRALFMSLGCAQCHSMKEGGKAVASSLKAPKLSALNAGSGCLADAPKGAIPSYALNQVQKTAISAAMKVSLKPADDKERIRHDLAVFNCLACHVRDGKGGPIEELNKAFQTTQPEMGDEARVPPWLNGVGAKMNADYLKKVLSQGADDRPYMHTRMPGFGAALGNLDQVFAKVDTLPVIPPVNLAEPESKVKAHGRMLVGGMAFGCIKCHTFAGNKAEGVQGIDMAIMTKRVRRDWFFAYVNDPQAIRPGTRMPAAFSKGKSVIDDVLGGTAVNQIEAIWVYLSEGNKARVPFGIQKKSIPLTATKGAMIYRNFIEGAGARGIGVGYSEKVNMAFDANDLRLALLWQGGFIDAARHWTDRGVGFEGPMGDNVVALPSGLPFARLESSSSAWPTVPARQAGWKFMGYSLDPEDRPTFRYESSDTTVSDRSMPVTNGKEVGLKREITISGKRDSLLFRAATGKSIDALEGGWYKVEGGLKVRSSVPVQIRRLGGTTELVIPVPAGGDAGVIVIEYQW